MGSPVNLKQILNEYHQRLLEILDDVVISRVFVTRAAYTSQDSPFLMNVHKEQVAV
jgi:hypothetical protein